MSIKNYLKIKNYKIKNWKPFIAAIFLISLFPIFKIFAQELPKVDYNNEVIVDSDLDGLTDKGEQQIYQTDPGNQDTDADGYLDGAEVLAGTNSLDATDYPGHRADDIAAAPVVDLETPWAWYIARASGFVGFMFLWLTIFLGLSIRNPGLKKIVAPIYSFDLHCFMAAAAVFWTLIHGTSLLFDKSIGFGVKDISIPYFSQTIIVNSNYLALGIMAFYAMVVLTITSYLRNHLKHWLWRILHFLHPVAFIFTVLHGYRLGTDMKNDWIGNAFLFASFILGLIYLLSLFSVLWNRLKKPEIDTQIS